MKDEEIHKEIKKLIFQLENLISQFKTPREQDNVVVATITTLAFTNTNRLQVALDRLTLAQKAAQATS